MKSKFLKHIQRILTLWGIAAGTAGLITNNISSIIIGGILIGVGISGWD